MGRGRRQQERRASAVLTMLAAASLLAGCASPVPMPSPSPTAAPASSPGVPTLAPIPTTTPVAVTATPLPAVTIAPVPAGALQLGDNQPLVDAALVATPDMADNKVGTAIGTEIPPFPPDKLYPIGFRWVRASFGNDVLNWQNVDRTPGHYTIDATADAAITDYAAHGMTVVMTLGAGDMGYVPVPTRFKDQAEIVRYGEYVRVMVHHFKDRVAYFELWNEPDGTFAVADYVRMVRYVVPIVRAEDPAAKIVIPGSSCHWESGAPGYGPYGRAVFNRGWLFGVLDSDVMPLVDAISWHPFYGQRANESYYQTYPDLVRQIKAEAEAHGFHGLYLASEMAWRSFADVNVPVEPKMPGTIAEKYLIRTTVSHRGLDVVAVIAPSAFDWTGIQNTNILLAGAQPTNLGVHVATKATHLRQYSFALADGSRLVALWTDWLPVEQDPGLAATVTIGGLGGSTAVAIDVMSGNSQRLLTSASGGALAIKDLLVKDYPTFIRIGAPAG
jgi:hypothetical protein